MLPILKMLSPKVVKAIIDYVFKKNDLDHQVAAIIDKVEMHEDRLDAVEKLAHPMRNFVRCN